MKKIYTSFFRSGKIILPVLLWLSTTANAQSIFTNTITATNPNTSNPYTTGQVVDPNLTVSGIGRGSGIAGTNANNRYNANNWSTGAIDLNDYFTFTLTPSPGFAINFTSLVYTSQASGTGPVSFAVRSSIDAFASNLGVPIAGATIDLSGAAFQNITTPVEFRVYGFGGSAAAGTFSINDFTFNGTVTLPLPVHLLSFDGVQQGNSVYFNWITTGSGTATDFRIEWLHDGKYELINRVPASDDEVANNHNYSRLVPVMADGLQTFRLAAVDRDGSIAFSQAIRISLKMTAAEVQIFPNPAKDRLFISHFPAGSSLQITDLNARVYYSGTAVESVATESWPPGLYLIRIGEMKPYTLIKQ